jgi:hypothetical protein
LWTNLQLFTMSFHFELFSFFSHEFLLLIEKTSNSNLIGSNIELQIKEILSDSDRCSISLKVE